MRPLVNSAVVAAGEIDGWMTSLELLWLAETAAAKKVIVEIGSWKGRSTKALAMASLGVVYAVDNWTGATKRTEKELAERGADAVYEDFLKNLHHEIDAKKVIPVRMDSNLARVAIARSMPSEPWADMVFIDGNHSYEAVRQDIEVWLPTVVTGGILCGHDYNAKRWPGVIRAVDERFPQRKIESTIWYLTVTENDRR